MAQKVKDVMFEEVPNEVILWVYTDATKEQLENIEGISLVESRPITGYKVYYDPRYDVEEIKREIRALTSETDDQLIVEKQWIERAIIVKKETDGDLKLEDAESFAANLVTNEWTLTDSARLNYDRVIVRFEGPNL